LLPWKNSSASRLNKNFISNTLKKPIEQTLLNSTSLSSRV
jgi:hypothetical protein